MPGPNVSRLKLIHTSSQHTYLVDTAMAERLAKRLSEDSDVAAVQVQEANEAEVRRFQSWEASTKTEEWFRVVKTQLEVKLVPATAKDVAQPPESSLMMAIYGIGKENLLQVTPQGAPKAPATTRHKNFS